jgi:hypothetical protein
MRRLVLSVALALAAGPALGDAARDALADLAKCADIGDSAQRLKCFDDAMPRAKSALAAPAPAPEAPTRSLLDWFGFSRPPPPATKPEEFGKPAPEQDELKEISSNVIEFAKTARGKALFVLENGQVWRQIDGDGTVVLDPPQGKTMKVLVERGLLGSYNLTIEGRNGLIKVTRLK